jgi:hypothetical protein
MPEPRLRVFPVGGRVTILDPGGSDRPTRLEVEWRNPSAERVQETEVFWASVRGHIDPFWFKLAGARYEPCHFEADSLRTEPMERGHRLVVRFLGIKAAKQ